MGEICLRCGGSNIQENVLFGSAGDGASLVGLKYRSGLIFNILAKTESTWCDLCLDCGEITRPFVQNIDREWWTKEVIDENKIF
jgi:hypothetical protein